MHYGEDQWTDQRPNRELLCTILSAAANRRA
uniref:Uncharacterized protein n=1 Tax=Anguilla anguilla TaxID=7936 RepID=A0A0E9UPL6_ANGAN